MFWADLTRPMKAPFDLGRLPGWWPKTIPVFLVFVAVVATGCGKANTAAPPVTQNSAAATPAAPSPAAQADTAAPQPVAMTSSNDSPQTLQLLNRALLHWMIKNRRHPENFEEFANSANIQIPDPPAGKKYALNGRGFIVLVDNQ